jgi:histone H3/H4
VVKEEILFRKNVTNSFFRIGVEYMPRLAIAPVRDLMKDAGAKLVSKDAVMKLVEFLEAEIEKITSKAIGYAKHAGRKKVMMTDVTLAIKG